VVARDRRACRGASAVTALTASPAAAAAAPDHHDAVQRPYLAVVRSGWASMLHRSDRKSTVFYGQRRSDQPLSCCSAAAASMGQQPQAHRRQSAGA
jgi:hypothetical protein